MTFSLDLDSVFDQYKEVVDFMNSTEGFGINNKVYYPSLKTECTNCYFNTLPGVGATNIYRPGGPYSFTDGICPYCEGLGYKLTESYEVIQLRVYFDMKTWVKFNPKIAIKDGDAVIIGANKDLPKLQHMAYIELSSDTGAYVNRRYELSKEPVPWGFRDWYFTANVSRVNG